MSVRRWLPWGMGGLVVLGLLLAGGCGGDDDEETADAAAGSGETAAGGGGSGGSADTGSATNAASDEAEADAYVARQLRYDPDLWVLEFEAPDGQPPFEAKLI